MVTTSKDAGYYAENTLAGSRLNSDLADLAASITVMTKQQPEDTAAWDINDVFKYEAAPRVPPATPRWRPTAAP